MTRGTFKKITKISCKAIKKSIFIFFNPKGMAAFIIFLAGCNVKPYYTGWAESDLKYMNDILLENHPGVYNPLDPNFSDNLSCNYQSTLDRLKSATSDTDRMAILKEFIASFNDTHVQINFFNEKNKSTSHDVHPRHIAISRPYQDLTWITLPTFEPNSHQQQELQTLYEMLPLLRTEKIIVFDLRGNEGGNSEWAKNIVTSLFSYDYACIQINRMNAAVCVDWRATADNLTHLMNIKQEHEHLFGDTSDFMQWVSHIIDGMQQALNAKHPYYTEKEKALSCANIDNKANPVRAKIFVIIDHTCVSAVLDFIDYLKAMQHPITLIGKTTKADSLYMEIRSVDLPSKKGICAFPIKVYRNRVRALNEPYVPDIPFTDVQNTAALLNYIGSITY